MKDNYLTVEDIATKFKVSYDTALGFVKYSGVEHVRFGRQYTQKLLTNDESLCIIF